MDKHEVKGWVIRLGSLYWVGNSPDGPPWGRLEYAKIFRDKMRPQDAVWSGGSGKELAMAEMVDVRKTIRVY